MLKIVLLDKSKDLHSLDFIVNLKHPITLVLPNPQLADDLRGRFLEREMDIITISRFMQSELGEKNEQKAHLIFQLIRSYKANFKNPSFDKFLLAFKYFTDFRSFSLDISPFEEVLPFLDRDSSKGVNLFWNEVLEKKLLDEHTSYHRLSEQYKNLKGTAVKNLIFYGFGHLSNLQVEMVQSLALMHDVYIPFMKRVYVKCQSTDWIKWIDTTFDYRETEEEVPQGKGRLIFYPKNKLAEVLSSSPIDSFSSQVDFYVLSKALDFDFINEIPLKGLNFKIKNDLYSQELETFFDVVEGDIKFRLGEFRNSAFKSKNFRLLKILSLLEENLEFFEDELDKFDLSVLKYVVSLNLPRTFSAPLLNQEPRGEIRGRDGLISWEPTNLNVVIIPSEDNAISMGSTKYPKPLEECLIALGPIQNPYVDFLITQELLLELFQEESSFLLVENGSNQNNDVVMQIINQTKLNKILELEGASYKEPEDQLEKYIISPSVAQSNLSAYKLQNFVDCPRKYYFSNISVIKTPSTTENLLFPQLGSIEHLVIAHYLTEHSLLDDRLLEEKTSQELEKFISQNKIILNSFKKKRALLEIKNYSRHGIIELLKLKKIFSHCEFLFEPELKANPKFQVRGNLDVLVICAEGFGILDFKRSTSSLPSQTGFKDFVKIQPWFYLNHYFMEKTCLFLGYVNISSPRDSVVICNDEEIQSKLCQGEFLGGCFVAKESIKELSQAFSLFEEEKFEQMNREKEFSPSPINQNVCNFCKVNQLCPKE